MITDKKIPIHLQKYISKQDYQRYTPINQAVWRFVMRQNFHFFGKHAHMAYQDGLDKSGILIERIPKVEEMSHCLQPYGWEAVSIDGLIPGVAFFDFQGHGFLPIATDIRSLEHIAYTPAPDMLHEAGGHAPILCDAKYSEYVKKFGEIGAKAISSQEEHELFLATRHLTQVMENPNSTPEMIQKAQDELAEKSAQATVVSEATEISRLYWWTVEYGLIGSVDQPRIYGAGLLSSIGEGQHCLSSEVKKIPFDLDLCIQTDYDVTKPQPQLFVCESFDQLIYALDEYSQRMAFQIGGTESLEKARRSGQVTTAQYSSGVQVSGVVTNVITDDQGDAIYFQTSGPTALSFSGQEIQGQGCQNHIHGFSAPIGRIKGLPKSLEQFTSFDCSQEGWAEGKSICLSFEHGVSVKGTIRQLTFENERLIMISFMNCIVTLGDRVLFQPEWGIFDMPVGERISSVFAGAADHHSFIDPQEHISAQSTLSVERTELDDLYQQIRDIRENKSSIESLTKIKSRLDSLAPEDWLLRLEMLELAIHHQELTWIRSLRKDLDILMSKKPSLQFLIRNGIQLAEQFGL